MESLPDQGFSCTQCGRCCRGVWSVEVDPRSRRALQAAGLQDGLERHGATWRTRTREGRCAYLGPQSRCTVHDVGKPAGCSQFPLLLTRTPDGVFVGASFYCPAIVANGGPALATMAAPLGVPGVGFLPLDAGRGRSMDWEQYRGLEARLREDLEAPDVALALFRRLEDFAAWTLRANPPRSSPARSAIRSYLLAVVVGSVESGQPSGAPEVTRALLHSEHAAMEGFGWAGDPSSLWSRLEGPLPAWLEAEIRRYLRALVFRKYPACDRPVVVNLTLLALLPWLCRWYTFAAAGDEGETVFQDWQRAVEWLELRLVTHVTGMEPLLASLSEAVLRQIPETDRRPRRLAGVAAAAVALGLLGSVGWQAFAPPPTVALVVEEPPGRAAEPELRQVLQAVGGHATFLLDLPHLHDVEAVRALAQEGHEVGANGVPEPQLDRVRRELERAHVQLAVVHPRTPEEAPELERHGYRVIASEGDPVPATLQDGAILVVRPGGDLEQRIRELQDRGVRFVSLPELH